MNHTVDRRNLLKISGTALGGLTTLSRVTAAENSTKRYIVDAKNVSVSELEQAGFDIVHDLSEVDIVSVRGKRTDLTKVTTKYAPDIKYGFNVPANPVPTNEGESATDEPGYFLQWDKQVQNIPTAHEITRGENTRIAIIDSGVAATHPDLEHAVNEDLSRNFTQDNLGAPGPWGGSHGTSTAGVVAANDQNERGVVGTAPGTEIIDCRISEFGKLNVLSDILAGIVYAALIDCDVANLGVGGRNTYSGLGGDIIGKLINRTTTFANQQGTLLTIPAGNQGTNIQNDKDSFFTSETVQTMTVSATGPIGFRWDADGDGETSDLAEPFVSPAFYTNYGTNVIDVGAPGGDWDRDAIGKGVPWYFDWIPTTASWPETDGDGNIIKEVTHGYAWTLGSSFSAPQAAGAAGLVQNQNPDATPGKIETILKRTASVPDDYDKTFYGAGFLDPVAALKNNNKNSGN